MHSTPRALAQMAGLRASSEFDLMGLRPVTGLRRPKRLSPSAQTDARHQAPREADFHRHKRPARGAQAPPRADFYQRSLSPMAPRDVDEVRQDAEGRLGRLGLVLD